MCFVQSQFESPSLIIKWFLFIVTINLLSAFLGKGIITHFTNWIYIFGLRHDCVIAQFILIKFLISKFLVLWEFCDFLKLLCNEIQVQISTKISCTLT